MDVRMVGGRRGLFGAGLEIGGGAAVNQYPLAAYIAMGIGALLLGWGAIDWVRTYPKETHHRFVSQLIDAARLRLIPILLIAVGASGIILIGVALVGAVAYARGYFNPRDPEIVVRTAPTLAAAPTERLIPRPPAELPIDAGLKAARLIQLKGLLADLKKAKGSFENSYKIVEARQLPRQSGSRADSMTGSFRAQAIEQIKKINDLAFTNRPFEADSVDQKYLSIPAPGEDAFGEDSDAKLKFRALHQLNINILKQTDTLAADMQKEVDNLEIALKGTPAAALTKDQ